jgi:ribonuclease VapC
LVVDSSAILAILLDEPDGSDFLKKLTTAPKVILSSATYLETCLVLGARNGNAEIPSMSRFLEKLGAEVISFTPEQAHVARNAWMQYGKGNHKAKLNFGDCFSYALSKVSGQPLLFKGKDFSLTDIKRV